MAVRWTKTLLPNPTTAGSLWSRTRNFHPMRVHLVSWTGSAAVPCWALSAHRHQASLIAFIGVRPCYPCRPVAVPASPFDRLSPCIQGQNFDRHTVIYAGRLVRRAKESILSRRPSLKIRIARRLLSFHSPQPDLRPSLALRYRISCPPATATNCNPIPKLTSTAARRFRSIANPAAE